MRELHIGRLTVARLRAAGIHTTDELVAHTATELLSHLDAAQVYEVACRMQECGRGLAPVPGVMSRWVANERHLKILRLRLIEGLTLAAIGERMGISREMVRSHLKKFFGLTGRGPQRPTVTDLAFMPSLRDRSAQSPTRSRNGASVLDPHIVAGLNGHMEGLGDKLNDKMKESAKQAVADLINEFSESAIGGKQLPPYDKVARAALLVLVEGQN